MQEEQNSLKYWECYSLAYAVELFKIFGYGPNCKSPKQREWKSDKKKKNKHFVEALPSDASSDNANQEKSHELSIPKRVVKPPN